MKTLTAYLQSAGVTGDAIGPATAALQAALNDAQSEVSSAQTQIQTEIRENQQARALAASFRKVADKAGVDLSALTDTGISAERRRELSDQAGQQVLDFVSTKDEQSTDAARILRDAGFDLDTYQRAGKDKRAELSRQFVDGLQADRSRLKEAERSQIYTDLKLDPKKASTVLGDVVLEKGKVLGKDAQGNPVEVETYGTKAADGTFTPVDKLLESKGWSVSELAPKAAPPAFGTPPIPGQPPVDLSWLGAAQPPTPTGGAPDLLGFLDIKPADVK